MILFLDSANHYSTAQIGTKYTTASNVTVVNGAGRLGAAALFFNTALTAKVTKTLTPSAFGAGGNLFTGSTAYATVVGSFNATPLQFGTNSVIRATIGSTGNWTLGGTAANFTDAVATPTVASCTTGTVSIGRMNRM